jgi:hypothetical protein
MIIGDIEILDVITCDDVRQEHNGKELLIGVYAGEIVVPEPNAVIETTFWVRFRSSKPGKVQLEFKVTDPDDSQVSHGRGTFDLERVDICGAFSTPKTTLRIRKSGAVKLFLKAADDDDYTLAGDTPVRIGPVPGV